MIAARKQSCSLPAGSYCTVPCQVQQAARPEELRYCAHRLKFHGVEGGGGRGGA
jgi:hypothetical protein